MAVSSFATNNLVKEHDIYIDFMAKRAAELKKDGIDEMDVLFYKSGIVDIKYNKNNSADAQRFYVAMAKWNCIRLAYKAWDECVNQFVVVRTHASYKSLVDISLNALVHFKEISEKYIEEAKCDYNKRINKNARNHVYDACRYLAMYWTYLDIIKDTKTQRYFPTQDTIKRAAGVFGYNSDENPFIMNGKYNKRVKSLEEQPMEEKTEVNDDILNTPIRDLNFTIRTFNCLYRSKILTLGDICMKSQRQLLKIRNLGRNSLNEIKAKLAEYDYYYMDLDSNAWKAKPKEESVVNICEQVAKTLGIQSPSEVLGSTNEEKPEMKPIVSVDEYDELYDKYNFLKTEYDKLDVKYDMLLKEKMDLEQYNSRLKDDINNLKDTNRGLEARLNGCNPYKMDTIDLVKLVISNMNKDKMDWLFLTLNGMTVDIHKKAEVEGAPRMSYTIRTREE